MVAKRWSLRLDGGCLLMEDAAVMLEFWRGRRQPPPQIAASCPQNQPAPTSVSQRGQFSVQIGSAEI